MAGLNLGIRLMEGGKMASQSQDAILPALWHPGGTIKAGTELRMEA